MASRGSSGDGGKESGDRGKENGDRRKGDHGGQFKPPPPKDRNSDADDGARY